MAPFIPNLLILICLFRHIVAAYFEAWSPCHCHGEGRRALVTGITGMLGSHIAEELLVEGYDVYGLVRPRSNYRNIASFSANITKVSGDLTDPWLTLAVLRKVEPHLIFHFAAQAFNSLSFMEPQTTLNTNLGTTLNLLEAVRQLGWQQRTRLLLAGSSTVYGASTEQWDGPIPESAPSQPVSPYGVSKAATEMLGLMYARVHGLQVVVPRIFIHLAARGVEALALHEFAKQISLIELGIKEPIIHHGDISTKRDITDIVDSAPVLICLAETAPSGTVVNIGSNMTYTIEDLLKKAVEMSTVKDIRLELDVSRMRAFDERVVVADISKVRELTGWRPQPDMQHLIQILLDYWRDEILSRHRHTKMRWRADIPAENSDEL